MTHYSSAYRSEDYSTPSRLHSTKYYDAMSGSGRAAVFSTTVSLQHPKVEPIRPGRHTVGHLAATASRSDARTRHWNTDERVMVALWNHVAANLASELSVLPIATARGQLARCTPHSPLRRRAASRWSGSNLPPSHTTLLGPSGVRVQIAANRRPQHAVALHRW